MNDNAKKWVEALRSGEYEQGTGALRKGDTYCCLGVACDLYSQENEINIDKAATSDYYWYGTEALTLPSAVAQWLGMGDNTYAEFGRKNGPDDQLSRMNDSGETFEKIAAVIESEPLGLFETN